ncbi:MAG: hypothetical protein B7Y53_01890 [Halothiobacillus sp. 28-55-5]|nr:MAG: hypothetical protein B7Y53_01890 [Halothiobacillus sp. 28-55-5]
MRDFKLGELLKRGCCVRSMQFGRWVFGLVFILFLTGCGFNQGPDKNAVRQILQDKLDPSGQVIVVQTINTLNAAAPADAQNPRWMVDVTATLLFKQSAAEVAGALQNANSVPNFLSTAGQISLMLQFGNFKAGETQAYHTRLVLLKGSSGWMPAN